MLTGKIEMEVGWCSLELAALKIEKYVSKSCDQCSVIRKDDTCQTRKADSMKLN